MKLRILSAVLAFLLIFSTFGALSEVTAKVYVRETGGTLNLRAGESTATESLGIVKHGDNVEVISLGSEWSCVYVPRISKTGYIKTKYLVNISGNSENANGSTIVTAVYGSAQPYKAPGEFVIDLDGDGKKETIRLELFSDSYGMDQSVISVRSANGNTDSYSCDVYGSIQFWFVKLDGTKRVYVFFSGDECSDDFVTRCFYWAGNQMQFVNFASPAPFTSGNAAAGGITSIEDGIVTISEHRDMLGTWDASMDYFFLGNALCYDPNGIWVVHNKLSDPDVWHYRAMTTKRPLPATICGSMKTLPTGTRLLLSAIDDINQLAYFITENGETGYFQVSTTSDGWSHTVNGYAEEDCFTNLFYAG